MRGMETREAVVIGAGRYQSSAIPSLRYTVPDAEAVYRTLIGPGGFAKDHVMLLTDNKVRSFAEQLETTGILALCTVLLFGVFASAGLISRLLGRPGHESPPSRILAGPL